MRKRISFFCEILILCLLVFACVLPGSAGAEQDFVVSGKDYVLPEDSNFDYSKATSTEKFFYGATSLGTLHLKGAIEKDTKYNGRAAYGAKGDLSIQYAYNGAYQMKKEEYWHVEGDGTRWIRDYDLGFLNNIAKGCIMIEKSPNASSWEKVIDPLKNYFDKARSSSESLILTIPESDYKNGMYYRVVVAYKFAKRTKANLLGIGDEYDRRKCVEVYEFYVSSEKNYVTISDLGHGYDLKDKASTDTGFMIRKNGSQATVTVNEKTCKDFDYFSEPGKYGIVVKTKLGKEYNYTITVTNGLDFTSLKPKAYYGGSLHHRSHGESFLALAEDMFRREGLYILDEPEAALSPRGIIRLMQRMNELTEQDCQFIIATHSPMLLCFPDAEVYQITEKGIDSVRFQDTDHYRTTVRFLQNPESAIEDILGRDGD